MSVFDMSAVRQRAPFLLLLSGVHGEELEVPREVGLGEMWECRTHVITPSSTVKQERHLPITEGMSVKDLADLQIKQIANHKTQLEGWERISSDKSAFSPSHTQHLHSIGRRCGPQAED